MWLTLKPQAESLLFAAVLLLLQPTQIEEVDRVLQSMGLNTKLNHILFVYFYNGTIIGKAEDSSYNF